MTRRFRPRCTAPSRSRWSVEAEHDGPLKRPCGALSDDRGKAAPAMRSRCRVRPVNNDREESGGSADQVAQRYQRTRADMTDHLGRGDAADTGAFGQGEIAGEAVEEARGIEVA